MIWPCRGGGFIARVGGKKNGAGGECCGVMRIGREDERIDGFCREGAGAVCRVLPYPKEADFHLRQGVSLRRPANSNLTGLSSASAGREACLLQDTERRTPPESGKQNRFGGARRKWSRGGGSREELTVSQERFPFRVSVSLRNRRIFNPSKHVVMCRLN